MQILAECLLHLVVFGEVFVLFASAVSLAIWLLKTLVARLMADPKTESELRQYHPQNLDYLKRAGQ